MVTVLQDQSGLAQGIQQASSSLAQAIQQRQMLQYQEEQRQRAEQEKMQQHLDAQREKQQQLTSLDQALASADFSTPEGQKSVLRDLIQNQVPIKDALSIMDRYKPDPVEAFLQSRGVQPQGMQPMQQGMQPQETIIDNVIQGISPGGQQFGIAEQFQEQTPTFGGRPQQQQQQDVFGRLSDSDLIQAAATGNPKLKAASQAEQERRNRDDKKYTEDRKFHSEGSRPWLKKIDDSREAIRSKSAALEMMQSAVEQGDLEFFSKDNFANFLGRHGEGLRSPEGTLLLNATKEFLLSNIQRAGSRPNQWIEQQISQMLPQIGRSKEANLSTSEALKSEVEVQELYRDQTDQIADFYRKQLGYVPENIGSLVDKAVQPLVQQKQDKLAYNLRAIKEEYGNLGELSKKKVTSGTPLTVEMATVFAKEYGTEKAFEHAKKLGYKIPSKEEYMRYAQ